jgi:hypothetical protein
MYLEIRYFYFIWKSDKTVCSRRGQFPLRGKGKGPLAQRSLPLRPPPETWGTPPYTVMAIRFPALMGRQSCRFLGSGPLYPLPAALWCFHLWNPLPETRDGEGKTSPQGDEGRETRIKQKTDRVVRSEAERTGVEIRRFGFALHFALHPQVRGYADLIFGYSAAGRQLPDFVGSA